MPKETAEKFIQKLANLNTLDMGIVLVLARDREVAEEMRERAANTAHGYYLHLSNNGASFLEHGVASDIRDDIRALPLDPPAEDKVCPSCDGERVIHHSIDTPEKTAVWDEECPNCTDKVCPTCKGRSTRQIPCPDCGTGKL